jgi:hypothetical protein
MSTDSFQLDTQRTMPGLDYLSWMKQAAESGKGLGAMLKEITSLQFGPGKLQPEEYFLYQLYDDRRYTPEAKRTFLGINGPTIPSPWAEIVNDKPTLTALLRGLDLPVPETQAIVHPDRTFGGAASLRSREEIKAFLRNGATYPLFGKPFDSACSLGTANISGYDSGEDAVVLSNQQLVGLDEFVDQIERFGSKYLFQSLMRPHPALVPIVGNRVSTIRMFVLLDREGCELLRASWKIPAVENGADNFWRAGNVLAGIDVASGRIGRTLRRTAQGTEPIRQHPITGASFDDLVFPQWDAMREVVLRAAVNLPGCHFQGWDVALTDRGPVLVELEGDGGDPIMEQLCFDTGLLQGRYLEFLGRAKEFKREKKAKGKARRAAILKRNLAQLARTPVTDRPADPIQAEDDPAKDRTQSSDHAEATADHRDADETISV